jgi:hypothetical protein
MRVFVERVAAGEDEEVAREMEKQICEEEQTRESDEQLGPDR